MDRIYLSPLIFKHMLVITDLHPPLKKEKAVFEAFILWNGAIVVISERKGAESLLLSQLGLLYRLTV